MITLRVQTINFNKHLSALKRIEEKIKFQQNDLPRKQAIDYAQLVTKNIMTQKHMGGYAPYNPKYRAWKDAYGRAQGFWKLFGDLVRSLSAFKIAENEWMGGIQSGIMDQGGKSWFGFGTSGKIKPIAMYGKVMEYGGYIRQGGFHPPRPIFKPTKEEYELGGFIDRGEEALEEIKKGWHH